MEDIGKVRRGYFVEGMGGAQFALPGAVDRLRAKAPSTVAVAATDPANLFGSAIRWPKHQAGRPARVAGSWVVISDGALAAYMDRRRILTFAPTSEATAAAIAGIGRRVGRLSVNEVDGEPAGSTVLGRLLLDNGFAVTPRGLAYRGASH